MSLVSLDSQEAIWAATWPDQGAEVLGIDLTMPPPKAPFEAVQCDLLDIDKLRQLITSFRPNCIYHLAAFSNSSDSFKRPLECYEVNLQGTLNLLEVTREHSSNTKLLLVSSCQVYGKTSDELLNENSLIRPQNPYASSKWLSERVALQYQENFGTRVVISRPFNHSGPGQLESFVVSSFCKQIATIEKETSHSTKGLGCTLRGKPSVNLGFSGRSRRRPGLRGSCHQGSGRRSLQCLQWYTD